MEAIHLGRAVINIQALWVIGTTILTAIVLFLFLEYSVPKKSLTSFWGRDRKKSERLFYELQGDINVRTNQPGYRR